MRSKFFAISFCLLLASFFLLCFCVPVRAEEVKELVAAGGSYSQTAAPQFSGTLLYAHNISAGLYSFTVIDVFARPVTPDPLITNSPSYAITTSTTTGIAQFLRSVGPARVYVVATIGTAAGGTNVGWAYTTGGCAYIPIGKRGWSLVPSFRALKSSIGEMQGIYGLAIGWGR